MPIQPNISKTSFEPAKKDMKWRMRNNARTSI